MARTCTFLLAALTLACTSDLPTGPGSGAATFQSLLGRPATIETTSRWETFDINWFSSCSSLLFVTGNYDIHLTTQFVTYPDGSSRVQQWFNVARGRLWDHAGNEYILQRIGQFSQEAQPGGTYDAEVEDIFRVISKDAEINAFLRLTLTLHYDGLHLIVDSSAEVICHGAGAP